MKKRSAIIVAIVFMMIGFAAVSTSLIINSNIKVSENETDFDVYFSKARLDTIDVYESVISQDKKTITFNTNNLSKVGDKSTLTYEVTNNSANYDAEVKVTCVPENNKYTSITNTLDIEDNIVPARNTAKGRVTITLNKTAMEETTEEYTCKLEFNAVERKEVGIEKIYTEKLLNGTDPVLSDNLIPVTIKDNGEVTYADITKEWYSYEDKVWANAVILEDGTSYNVGDTIKESDIQSYFVWIPRYKYKLFNVDNYSLTTVASASEVESKAQEIDIEFENKDTAISNGTTNGSWLTHPAFTSFDTNGMWVGKFETGYKGATSKTAAQVNSSDSSKVIIKPNVYSWRNITVKNIFETSYNYNRDADSHMMKNTEWGAVAYLSHSKYGIDKEININNNTTFKTGYSSIIKNDQSVYPGINGDGPTFNSTYNTTTGYLASTTGNISGVYDMSGGAHEYVSAYLTGSLGSSGFDMASIANFDAKYFDLYNASTSSETYQNRILGDATGEMGPFFKYYDGDNELRNHNSWYDDFSYFINSSVPWLHRGGGYYNGSIASQFNFSRNTGGTNYLLSFRIVLSP